MNDVQMIVIFALCIAVPLSALTWLITAFFWSRRYNAYQKMALEELERMETYYNKRVRERQTKPFDQDQP